MLLVIKKEIGFVISHKKKRSVLFLVIKKRLVLLLVIKKEIGFVIGHKKKRSVLLLRMRKSDRFSLGIRK